MSLTPIKATVGPVTIGGNNFFNSRGLMNERPISRSAHREHVPRIAPYPSGHGSFFPDASVGHIPLAYIWESAFVAIGMMANDVPTTEIKPVPT